MADKNKQAKPERKNESDARAEAGRKGGETTKATHGPNLYEEIGHKGGEASGGNKVKNNR